VEILDQYFGNVCELDLIFNFHKVDAIIDQMIVGGEVVETSKKKILAQLRKLDTMG
jgi:AP-2 complex subunit sigma-1